MRNLNGRLLKLKKENTKSKKMPVTIGLVYLGDDDWLENENLIKEKYHAENGTLDGLKIFRHRIPEPLALPKMFKDEQEESEGGDSEAAQGNLRLSGQVNPVMQLTPG